MGLVRGLVCFVFLGVAFAGMAPEDGSGRTCTKQPADFTEFVSGVYTNGVPFAGARSFSPCAWAVPAGLDLLKPKTGSTPAYSINVVLTLGILGHIEAISGLITFLEGRDWSEEQVPSYASYIARVNVPIALGCILSQIDLDLDGKSIPPINSGFTISQLQESRRIILQYLVNGLGDRGVWQNNIRWTSTYDPSELDRDVYLAKKAVQGLGLSGDDIAKCVLIRTREHLQNKTKGRLINACGVEINPSAHHWGRESLKQSDEQQLERLLRDAIATNVQVKACKGGLMKYYDDPSSCLAH